VVRFRGVLFDLDDTLTDRDACLARASEVFARTFGGQLEPCEPRLIAQAMHETEGRGYRPRLEFFGELIARLPWKKAPDVGALAAFWEVSFAECSVEREGATTLLASLESRGLRLGVVTNGRTAIQQRKIDALGIRRFLKCTIVSEAAGFKKPDLRIFELALRTLDLQPDECLFVGDHPVNDILGSRDAGLTAVWLTGMHPWPAEVPEPELQITRLGGLEPLLAKRPSER
jgi:putative hydrolase of the HAD superfamily